MKVDGRDFLYFFSVTSLSITSKDDLIFVIIDSFFFMDQGISTFITENKIHNLMKNCHVTKFGV